MLPTEPTIIAAIADQETAGLPPDHPSLDACDWLEWRLDCLPDPPASLKQAGKPVIVTVRHPAEGGAGSLSTERRRALYLEYLRQANVIDLEIRSLEDLRDVAQLAGRAGIPVLASFHDFERTPLLPALEEQLHRAREFGVEAVKFATRADSTDELFTLIEMIQKHGGAIPMSVMGMGRFGMVSRLLLAQCGSLFNYAYLHRPNAPGQWSARALRAAFESVGLR